MNHRCLTWIISLLTAAIAAAASGDLERVSPEAAHDDLARADGVVLVDVYAEF